MFALVKVIVSAVLISVITEVAKIYPKFGGMIAALPLVSLLSLCWLYVQGEATQHLSKIFIWRIMGISGNRFFAASHSLMFEGLFFPDCIYCPWHWRLGNVFAHAEHRIQTSIKIKNCPYFHDKTNSIFIE